MPTKKTAVTVVLAKPQAKKHVVRYDATEDDAAITAVYVNKAAITQLGNPESIKLTVEAA